MEQNCGQWCRCLACLVFSPRPGLVSYSARASLIHCITTGTSLLALLAGSGPTAAAVEVDELKPTLVLCRRLFSSDAIGSSERSLMCLEKHVGALEDSYNTSDCTLQKVVCEASGPTGFALRLMGTSG